MPIAGPAPFF